MITVPLSGIATTLIEVSFRNIRLTICHVIGERKRGTYGGAICRRNEQKNSIYFMLAFLRLVVSPIDRSSFSSLKISQGILQITAEIRRKNKKV